MATFGDYSTNLGNTGEGGANAWFVENVNNDSTTNGRAFVKQTTVCIRLSIRRQSGADGITRAMLVKRTTGVNGTSLVPANFFEAPADGNSLPRFPQTGDLASAVVVWDLTVPYDGQANMENFTTTVNVDMTSNFTTGPTVPGQANVTEGSLELLLFRQRIDVFQRCVVQTECFLQ